MTLFSKASVIGAGTMGHGIAQVNAMAGLATTLIDVDARALQKAQAAIQQNLELGVSKNKISEEVAKKTLLLLDYRNDFDSLSDSDLLIEAVPEKLALKQSIFKQADSLLPANALLATNTSSLAIGEIATSTTRPNAVVGLHFFNPPHIMRLLEIIRSEYASDDSIQRCEAYAKQIGKTSITVKDSPGFATSRLGICLANEAMRMLEQEVATPTDIDRAMVLGYGHPIGPLHLTDLVGLDVRLAISEYLSDQLEDNQFRPPDILKKKVSMGHLGKKTGQGFYHWQHNERLSHVED